MAFDAADAASAGEALVCKAECYARAGDYEAAAATLDRVGLYSLDSNNRTLVLARKALYLALAGRLDEYDAISPEIDTSLVRNLPDAAVYLAVSEYINENRPALKSQDKAFLLGFLPPAAHIYAGLAGEGVLRAAGDAASIAVGVLEAISGNWVTAFLSCSIGLYECYWKGNATIAPAVEECNKKALNEFRASLKEYIDSIISGQ